MIWPFILIFISVASFTNKFPLTKAFDYKEGYDYESQFFASLEGGFWGSFATCLSYVFYYSQLMKREPTPLYLGVSSSFPNPSIYFDDRPDWSYLQPISSFKPFDYTLAVLGIFK